MTRPAPIESCSKALLHLQHCTYCHLAAYGFQPAAHLFNCTAGKLTETQVLLSHADKLHLDRYGFIVTQEEAASKAARVKRSTAQTRRDQRHVHKWRRMLGSSRDDFKAYWASRPKKVKRRVRKGIPDEFRGLVWQYLSGAEIYGVQLSQKWCMSLH